MKIESRLIKRCGKCSKWCRTHEAWPQIKVLIDQDSEMPHKCDPKIQIVQTGKWKGYSYAEMARIWSNQKIRDKQRLKEIADKSVFEENT